MSEPGSRTLWEEGTKPGREMVMLGVALAFTLAAIDLLLTHRISLWFDLGFIVVCVALALAVRPGDFFAVGVLPPLLMLGTFVVLAISRSDALADTDAGLLHTTVSGLAHHSLALVLATSAALAVLAIRSRVTARSATNPHVPA